MSFSATRTEATQPSPLHNFNGPLVEKRTRTHKSARRAPAGRDVSVGLLDLATANRLSSVNATADGDAVSTYMARLHRVEPLEAAEQHLLACRYVEDGDLDAAKLLVLTNL